MPRIITGLFDSRAEAERLVQELAQHDGITRDRIRVHGQDADTAPAEEAREKGFWASLKDLFVPDEDRYAYSEGIRRGGTVVSAEVDDTQLEPTMTLFERHGAVDLEEREAEWRKGGWAGAASRSDVAATERATVAGEGASGDQVIPLVEETLQVGKRDVERGRVRVRTYVVETPVSEQVGLRSEHVEVERRPVDRPVADGGSVFQERTIEATEHAEEAVIAKQAHVREELVIRKEATERTETVRDTTRRTEIEVENAPASEAPRLAEGASAPAPAGAHASASPAAHPATDARAAGGADATATPSTRSAPVPGPATPGVPTTEASPATPRQA